MTKYLVAKGSKQEVKERGWRKSALSNALWLILLGPNDNPDLPMIVIQHNQEGDPYRNRTFSPINAFGDAYMLDEPRYNVEIWEPGAIVRAGKNLEARFEDRVGMVHQTHDFEQGMFAMPKDLFMACQFQGWAMVDIDHGVFMPVPLNDRRTDEEVDLGDTDTRLLGAWKYSFFDALQMGYGIAVWIAHVRKYVGKRIEQWKLPSNERTAARNNAVKDHRTFRQNFRGAQREDYLNRRDGLDKTVDQETGEIVQLVPSGLATMRVKLYPKGTQLLKNLPSGRYALADRTGPTGMPRVTWDKDNPSGYIKSWERVIRGEFKVIKN